MEINDEDCALHEDLSNLLRTSEDRTNALIEARQLIDKGYSEERKESVMHSLFLIEDNLRETALMLNRCYAYIKKHLVQRGHQSEVDKDYQTITSMPIQKEEYSKIDLAKQSIQNKDNSINSRCNGKIGLHDTSETGSFYISLIKPKLNFTYNSEEELKAIMHHEPTSTTTKANQDNIASMAQCEGLNIDLKEPIKEQLPICYSFRKEQGESNKPPVLFNENQLDNASIEDSTAFKPIQGQNLNEKDMKVMSERDDDNLYQEIEDDTLNKLIIQNQEEGTSDINPIDTASKIKSKATRVAQLVTLIHSNPDLFELLSQLFETDSIIDLLLSDDVDESLIDSISASIEELERLEMIDEYNEFNSQQAIASHPQINQTEDSPLNSKPHKTPQSPHEADPLDKHFSPKPTVFKSSKPLQRKIVPVAAFSKDIKCKKQRKRTKINLIAKSSFNKNINTTANRKTVENTS